MKKQIGFLAIAGLAMATFMAGSHAHAAYESGDYGALSPSAARKIVAPAAANNASMQPAPTNNGKTQPSPGPAPASTSGAVAVTPQFPEASATTSTPPKLEGTCPLAAMDQSPREKPALMLPAGSAPAKAGGEQTATLK